MTLTERIDRAISGTGLIRDRDTEAVRAAVLDAIEASGTHAVIDRDRAMHMLNIMPRTRVVEQLIDLIAARPTVTP